MTNAENTVAVELMGKEYRVACPEESRQDLERAANLLSNRMDEIKAHGKLYGTERVAIMAALNLAYDYLNAIGGSESMQTQMRQINRKLENALAQDQQLDFSDQESP
ncbi:cell division protein ZapA [Bermanella sp. R86510]|uniref:cell division protein ZapA n=1 Tax=unclassified Bermanella TaxID=2627862 RepID=UPI0037C4F6DC